MSGGTLGSKAVFQYTSDDGNTYSIRTLSYLGTAAGLTTGVGAAGVYPRGRKARHAWLQEPSTKRRKKLIFGTAAAMPSIGASVTVDGTDFQVMGLVGEKISGNF